MVFCGEVVFHFLTRPPHQSWFCCLLTLHTFTSRLGWGSFNSQLNNFLIFCFKFVWQNTRRREYRERHSAQTVLCLPNKNRLVCWLYCGKMYSRDWLRSPQVCDDSQTCRFNRVQEFLNRVCISFTGSALATGARYVPVMTWPSIRATRCVRRLEGQVITGKGDDSLNHMYAEQQ